MNEIEYICDCEHTSTMHSAHDGCSICDCERNREDVVTIGQLLRISHELDIVTHEFSILKENLAFAERAIREFLERIDDVDNTDMDATIYVIDGLRDAHLKLTEK